MHRIYPICTETVQPHLGQQVCIVTHDGRHLYGCLDGIRGGKLYLLGCQEGPKLSAIDRRAKAIAGPGNRKRRPKAKTKSYPYGYGPGYGFGPGFGPGYGGYPPYGYGPGRGIELALIATLFLLPFLFI